MNELFKFIRAEAGLFDAQAKLAKARFENTISRLGNAIRLWEVEGDYEGLQKTLPSILGGTDMLDIRAVHYICTPPPDSGLEERRYTSDFSILSQPDITIEELKRIRQADEDFKHYIETLPTGSKILATFTDRQNRILGTATRNK